ncbi:MAG: serine/threonine protein kinase [Clostridiales bacterium]|nr:serine/threonine protein kinase [Clostridiales bacterium]
MRCLNCMKTYEDSYGVCPYCGFVPGTPPREAYHLYPGTVLKNRYEIGTTVGFGGFGITYRAWDNVLDKMVAIKEYYPNGMVNRVPGEKQVIIYSGKRADEFQNGKTRFLAEARNMARFNKHPNIVNVYEFFEENNTAYIAMEFLDGISYKDYIKKCGGSVSAEVAVSVVTLVLDALRELHKVNIIHRDISPDNIFMVELGAGSGRYRVKLIDFGAARFSSGEEEKTLSIILKPGYAPPEQYRSRSKQGPWTDIYAVGAVLYRSVTGRMPDESVNRMIEDHMAPPKALVPSLPQYLNDSIMRAMALNQELRFQNVDQFRDAIQNKTKVLDVGAELKRRKRIRALGIAGAVVLLAGAGLVCRGIYVHRQNSLYNIAAAITVQMPDVNASRVEEVNLASQIGAGEDNGESKQIDLESTEAMLERMLTEYGERYQKVYVLQQTPVEVSAYDDYIRGQAGEEEFPSVLETSGITSADTGVWQRLGTLDTTYETIDTTEYYFMGDAAFQQSFAAAKKQIPVSFCAPVLYVNTHQITDEETLNQLADLISVKRLSDENGEPSFCVSATVRDMYREAFRGTDEVDQMEEFAAPGTDEKGYELFLSREKAYYLGTTDDYEAIRASLGGIYSMVVMDQLQSDGRIKGQFTHLWSIDGNLTGDAKSAADSLVYYLLSENAQDIFNLQDGNGLSLNKTMLSTYVSSNDEFEDIVGKLDTLQMEY